jgi:fructokinase
MRIGVDLGGTKIEAIALDETGATVARRRVATPVGDYAGTIRAIADLVAAIEAEHGPGRSVGVGTPGAISSRTGLMKNANSTVLNGKPLDRDLSSLLGRPVPIENDANCFALSEAIDGAGAGTRTVFGVILGTGVGGGVIVEGRIQRGANAIAGEWGHNPLPWAGDAERPGEPCYCGRVGCIETFLSGAGLRRLDPSGRPAEAIARAAAAGEPEASAALDLYRDRLARALASVINILDPDVVVLGGGLSNIDQVYDGLAGRVSLACFSDGVDTPILRHRHGDSSGVRGAAWLGAAAG